MSEKDKIAVLADVVVRVADDEGLSFGGALDGGAEIWKVGGGRVRKWVLKCKRGVGSG